MRKLWVFLLAVPLFGLGAFLGVAYQGAVLSIANFRIACELLNASEHTGVMTKAQRADVVERAIDTMRKGESSQDRNTDFRMFEEFETGCPVLPTL